MCIRDRREAGEFWRELEMRPKTNIAVKEVREEHSAGRLGWNVEDIQRIIKPYPPQPNVDAVLRKWRTALGSLKAKVHMKTRARGRSTIPRTRRVSKRIRRG